MPHTKAQLSAYEQARAWLLDYLSDGKYHTAGEVFINGGLAGHSEQMLRSAAKRCGVRAVEACYGYGRASDVQVVLWQLPKRQ